MKIFCLVLFLCNIHLLQAFDVTQVQNKNTSFSTLLFAIQSGNIDTVHECLKDASLITEVDDNGWTALHHAVNYAVQEETKERVDIVTLLIETGFDVNAKAKDGTTPFYIATNGTGYVLFVLLEAGAVNPDFR